MFFCDSPIHTMLYCTEYLLSLRADLNNPADTKTAHLIPVSATSVTLKWRTAESVCDLQTSADTDFFFSSVCFCRCRRLCSIMSWVAESSSEIPPDVSKSMTLFVDVDEADLLWIRSRKPVICNTHTENCELHHVQV